MHIIVYCLHKIILFKIEIQNSSMGEGRLRTIIIINCGQNTKKILEAQKTK